MSECTARVKLELTDFKWEDGKPVDKTVGKTVDKTVGKTVFKTVGKTVDKIKTRDGSDIYVAGGNFLNGLSLSETKAYWKNQAKNQGKDMPP